MDRELQELTARVKVLEESDVEHRRVQRMIYGDMGKLVREVSNSRADISEIKSIVHRLESSLIGSHRERAASHHDMEEVARQVAKETAAEITGGHIIPPGGPKTPSERVRQIITNERNEAVAGVVKKVALAVLISLALVGTGLAIRDCQHGTVPAQGH